MKAKATATAEVFAFPASFAQERLWTLTQMYPDDPAYHIAAGVRFKGNLNRGALQASFDGIIQRQESLRTTFRAANGKVVQIVASAGTVTLLPLRIEKHTSLADTSVVV